MKYECKCGYNVTFLEEKGNKTGLYCSSCGKWIKWLSKEEIRLFNHENKAKNAINKDLSTQIIDVIYQTLDDIYCDNCRFGGEISEKESAEQFGYWGCEDCHRKYNGWGISKAMCKHLANKILQIVKD